MINFHPSDRNSNQFTGGAHVPIQPLQPAHDQSVPTSVAKNEPPVLQDQSNKQSELLKKRELTQKIP